MTQLPCYDGPIFDADSHIREIDWSFSRKYLPEMYWPDWLMESHVLPGGTLQLRIGSRGVENMESADGKMAPPGKLKGWLRTIATDDKTIERILPEPKMYACPEQLAKLDEVGVDGCAPSIGDFVNAFGLLGMLARENGPEGANTVFRAYNEYLYAEWSYNREDRIYATHMLSLWDLAWSLEEVDHLDKIVENSGSNVGCLLMGPDYPHAEGVPPQKDLFTEICSGLPEQQIRQVMHDSGRHLQPRSAPAYLQSPQ